MMYFRSRLRAASRGLVLAAVPAVAVGAMIATSVASAQAAPRAAHAATAPKPVPHGTVRQAAPKAPPCNQPSYLCFWVNSGWSGNMGKFSGNNVNWGAYGDSQCVYPAAAKDSNGTWNDCASSLYNDGTSGLGADVYQNSNFGGAVSCIPDLSTLYSNLANWDYGSNHSVNMNDSITSNNWGPCS